MRQQQQKIFIVKNEILVKKIVLRLIIVKQVHDIQVSII